MIMLKSSPQKLNWWAELSALPFFYPYFTTIDQVNEFASRAGQTFANIQGTYFLRPSLTQPGQLTITVNLSPFNIRHFKITFQISGCYQCCHKNERFLSISELILHHKTHGFRKHDGTESAIRLTKAILQNEVNGSIYENVLCMNDKNIGREIQHGSDNLTTDEIRDVCVAAGKRFVNKRGLSNGIGYGNDFKGNRNPGINVRTNPLQSSEHNKQKTFTVRAKIEPKMEVNKMIKRENPKSVSQFERKLDTYVLNHLVGNRPPLPIPKRPRKKCVSFDTPEAGPSSASQELCEINEILYSEPNNCLYLNRPSAVIQRLQSLDYTCGCNIPSEESKMADDWTLHWCDISCDIFFQNFNGETRWRLPNETYQKLDNFQKAAIERYRCSNSGGSE